MSSETIVEKFNVLKDTSFSLRLSEILAMMNQLSFQGAEETFHGSIVVTITGAAHTTLDLSCSTLAAFRFISPGRCQPNPTHLRRFQTRMILCCKRPSTPIVSTIL